MGMFLAWEEMGKDCKDQRAHMVLSRDPVRLSQAKRADARAEGLKHENLARLVRYEARACKLPCGTTAPEPDRPPPP